MVAFGLNESCSITQMRRLYRWARAKTLALAAGFKVCLSLTITG